MESIISDDTLDACLLAYKRLIKLLYKLGDLKLCLEQACSVVNLFTQDIYAYEWICKIFVEHYDSVKQSCLDALKNPIDFYAEKLLELNQDSSLGLFAKAIQHYQSQKFVAAREFLYKIQIVQPDYHKATKLLAMTEMQLEAYGLAELLWYQLKENESVDLAICLSYSNDKKKINDAIDILKTKETSLPIRQALAR